MDARRTDTAERLLDLAERQVMQRGYNGFSYQHLADELGIKTAAVHYHFRTKPDLVVAVLERYGQKFEAWASSVSHLDPAERLGAYFDVGRRVVADERVCALAMISNELATVPSPVRDAVMAVQLRILGFYEATLREGRDAGVLAFPGAPADQAAEVGCALVGAQALARVFGPSAYERVVGQLQRALVGSPRQEASR